MKVTLDVHGSLADDEINMVRQLLRDALGEFISARGGHELNEPANTLGYVNKCYPDLEGFQREQKIDEVMARKQLAKRLLRADVDVEVLRADVEPSDA